MFFRFTVSAAIVILVALFIVPKASAHNKVPRVEISLERMNPGGVVDIRGVSFGMDDIVSLSLIGTDVDITLGEVTANAEGDFTYIAVLPVELVEGAYYFRAVTSHHYVLSPPLTVWGTAFIEGGGQGLRDEDDGLLAPMPTLVSSAATLPAPALQTDSTPVSVSNRNSPTPIALAVLSIFIVTMLLALKRKYS
jgi:hypothetical protein